MSAMTAIRLASGHDDLISFYDTLAAERDALSQFLARSQRGDVAQVIALLARHKQPIIFTGMGKSGHIAAKAAATFSSLGNPAFFINPAEAAHGDLGMVQHGSCIVMLSNSGSTEELLRLVPSLKARHCTLVGIVGRKASPLASACDHLLLAEVSAEADPLGMAPTSSTTLQLAICDGLAVAVSQRRGFSRSDFLRHHPAGLLGRQAIPVASLMRTGDDLPKASPGTPLLELLSEMSSKRMGAACVVDDAMKLIGLVVDGDVRRALQHGENIAEATAASVMQSAPFTVSEHATLGDVLGMRKASGASLLVMPVTDASGYLRGMLHTQDILG
jgi:arabinose-5-phosphate isomerase